MVPHIRYEITIKVDFNLEIILEHPLARGLWRQDVTRKIKPPGCERILRCNLKDEKTCFVT